MPLVVAHAFSFVGSNGNLCTVSPASLAFLAQSCVPVLSASGNAKQIAPGNAFETTAAIALLRSGPAAFPLASHVAIAEKQTTPRARHHSLTCWSTGGN